MRKSTVSGHDIGIPDRFSVVIGIPSALAGSSFVGQIISCIAAVVFLIGFKVFSMEIRE